jgi:sterol-4alpha-carboxylate 3-dehydrogenase (decarboxylating)
MAAASTSPLGKVMVIGGMGFVGHHVVKLLVERYQTDGIFVVDLHAPSGSHQLEPKPGARISHYEADITDPHELQLLFKKTQPDVVIHTASPLPQADTLSTRMLYDKVNIEGTRSVVKACQMHGVKALVYTSSASVISDHNSDLCNADERWPCIKGAQQREYYAESKVRNRHLFQ